MLSFTKSREDRGRVLCFCSRNCLHTPCGKALAVSLAPRLPVPRPRRWLVGLWSYCRCGAYLVVEALALAPVVFALTDRGC